METITRHGGSGDGGHCALNGVLHGHFPGNQDGAVNLKSEPGPGPGQIGGCKSNPLRSSVMLSKALLVEVSFDVMSATFPILLLFYCNY